MGFKPRKSVKTKSLARHLSNYYSYMIGESEYSTTLGVWDHLRNIVDEEFWYNEDGLLTEEILHSVKIYFEDSELTYAGTPVFAFHGC